MAVKTGGARGMVFAGGDPSIRPDICMLIEFARSIGLLVEVHTNAQCIRPEFLELLREADLVGLSLDGPDAEIHDGFRGKPGNFDKVLTLLRQLSVSGTPIVVRTVVAKPNFAAVYRIARIIEHVPNVVRWSLMEFSAVGNGYQNRDRYELDRNIFDGVARIVAESFGGNCDLHIYRNEDKVGAYLLVSPNGDAYTTKSPLSSVGTFEPTASIVRDHLRTVAARLGFLGQNSEQRHDYIVNRRSVATVSLAKSTQRTVSNETANLQLRKHIEE